MMNVEEALQLAQRQHIILIPQARTVRIWAPNTRVDRELAATIRRNQREVLRLLRLSHILTCPSPDLHRSSWDYRVKRWCCDICVRLQKEVN